MGILKKIITRLRQLTDGRYRKFYLQRLVSDIDQRERWSDRLAARLPAAETLSDERAIALVDALEHNGYAPVDFVTPAMIADLQAYFADKRCGDPYRPRLGRFNPPDDFPAGVHVAYFDANVIIDAPHVFDIFNNPVILQAVGALLGAKPTLAYMTAWWTLPAGDGEAQQAENFHRDVDDWRFIKYFIYLTDVDEQSGPHIFVAGSHRDKRFRTIRRYAESEIADAYDDTDMITFTGPAGTCFLENTSGFHRGLPALSRPRLALACTYALRAIPYGPRYPVGKIGEGSVPGGVDPYTNRIYCEAGGGMSRPA